MTKNKTKNTTTKTAPKVEVPDEMRLAILAQLTDYKIAPVKDEELTKEINYVLAANGLFKVTKKPVAVYTEKVEDMTVTLPGLPKLEEGFRLLIPKIPGKYAIQLLSWYRDVYTKDGTECSALFFWNHRNIDVPTHDELNQPIKGLTVDGQLVLYIPEQENEPGLSSFGDDPMVDWFRQNMSLLLESHSHNSMDAFFSNIDDANENMTQFYHVWGRVDQDMPKYVLRYVVGNTRRMVNITDIFDLPQVEVKTSVTTRVDAKVVGDVNLLESQNLEGSTEDTDEKVEHVEYSGPWPMLEYPDDWMSKHSKARPVATTGGWQKGKVWDPVTRSYQWPEYLGHVGAQGSWNSWSDYLDEEEEAYAAGKPKAGETGADVFTYELDFPDKADDNQAVRLSILNCLELLVEQDDDDTIRYYQNQTRNS